MKGFIGFIIGILTSIGIGIAGVCAGAACLSLYMVDETTEENERLKKENTELEEKVRMYEYDPNSESIINDLE